MTPPYKLQCPHCTSTSIVKRSVAYEKGTSITKGKRYARGLGTPLFGRGSSRIWSSGTSMHSTRQSLWAKQAAPRITQCGPVSLGLLIAAMIFGAWVGWVAFVLCVLLACIVSALEAGPSGAPTSHDEADWLCNRCGHVFVPNLSLLHAASPAPSQPVTKSNPSATGGRHMTPFNDRRVQPSVDESTSAIGAMAQRPPSQLSKACAVCRRRFPLGEFEYGNRTNNSYCKACKRENQRAYQAGGVAAAKRFRNSQRPSRSDRSTAS